MRKFFGGILGLGLAIGASAALAATRATLSNHTDQRLCAAFGHETREEGRITSVILGYECIEPGATLVRGIDHLVYLAVLGADASDYLATQAQAFPEVVMWAPAAVTDEYGIEIFERPGGGYSYTYFIGSDDWAAWQRHESLEGVQQSLVNLGFRRVKGWALSESALGTGGAWINLNE